MPSPGAAAHSATLVGHIVADIGNHGGWISFARFMELALYAPGLGYYSARARKIGARADDGSDFTTAPERTPLFAQALARPIAALIAEGATSIVEFGAGSGALARDLLAVLEAADALPDRYDIVEVSAELRERQRATIDASLPRLASRVRWLSAWPEVIDGVVVANEVLDALPVRWVFKGPTGWTERGVIVGEQGLAFADRPIDAAGLAAIPRSDALPVGYLTERHEALDGWVATLLERMSSDAVALLIDYGFPASEYFHPQRADGTLIAHYRHRANTDLLARIGLQDLTAHVDFSAVARIATAQGAQVIGYTTQQAFLLDCGIADSIGPASAVDPRTWARQAAALQMLLSEAEMGELFKVIALARRNRVVRGFGRSDRRAAL
jgi:SAM-dependent MidA family methyltransferase